MAALPAVFSTWTDDAFMPDPRCPEQGVAVVAYQLADLMLKARGRSRRP